MVKAYYRFFYVTFGKSKDNITFHTRHTNAPNTTRSAKQLKKLFNVKAIASYGWEQMY